MELFLLGGKLPDERQALNILVKFVIAISGSSFIIVLLIPLSPGHDFFIFLI